MFDNGSYLRRRRRFKRSQAEKEKEERLKRMGENKDGLKESLEEGEVQKPSSGNMSSNSGSGSDSATETPVKLEKDDLRPHTSLSPGELSREAKMEPSDTPHNDCGIARTTSSNHSERHMGISDRVSGGSRLGVSSMSSPHHSSPHHSSHLTMHPQLQAHGLGGLQGHQNLCGVSSNPLSLSHDSTLDPPGNNFSVENFLASSHHLSNGSDIGGTIPNTPRPPPLVSPHLLPYSPSYS